MSLLRRASGAYLWSQIGRFVELCLFFGFSVLLARVLGPQRYGIYATGLSAAGLCIFATLLGIGPETLGKFVPEISAEGGPARIRELLMKLLALRYGAVLVLAIVAGLLSRFLFRQWCIRFFGGAVSSVLALFAARTLYDLTIGLFGALLELRAVAVAKLVAGVTALVVFVLAMVEVGPTVDWALAATALGYLVGGFALMRPLLRRAKVVAGERAEPLPMRRILEFGVFAWGVNFFIFVLSDNTDVLMVRWLTRDPNSAGYYAVGARMVFRLVTLAMAWVPLMGVASLSHANVEGCRERIASGVEAQWKVTVVSLVPALAFLYCFAYPITGLLFSTTYLPSLGVVRILCVFMACSALAGFYLHSGILYVLDHERLAAAIVGAAALFNIALEVYLVPRMGIAGAALATGGSYLLLSLSTALASARVTPVRVPWAFNLKVTVASIVAGVPALWSQAHTPGQLASASALWMGLFVVALAVLRPLERSDLARLCRLSPRLGAVAEKLFVHGGVIREAGQPTW